MFKWLTNMFKDDRCECRGCMVTRYGWGYAPCSNVKVPDLHHLRQDQQNNHLENLKEK